MGVVWSVAASFGTQAVSFLVFAVLARQLTPLEFGVVALATVFLDLLTLVGRGGLTEVLIQRVTLDQTDKSTAFWNSLALGLLGTVVLWLGAQAAATYFHSADLAPVMRGLAIACTLNVVGTVHEALLKRTFGFKALAIRTLLAAVVSGAAALAAAYAGWGAMSLVVQRIVATVLLTGIMWWAVRWWPSFSYSRQKAAEQMRMGLVLCGSALLGAGNQRIIDIVIGRLLGAQGVGLFRIAWRGLDLLMQIGLTPINQVTLPLFSRLQNDPKSLGAAYLRVARVTALVIYPVFIGSAIIAPEFIRLAFGSQWDGSVQLMQILALGVVAMPMIWFKSNALIAIGKSRAVMWLNIVEFALSLAVVIIACQWGVTGAAWGNTIRLILAVLPIWLALRHFFGIRLSALLYSQFPAFVCTVMMGSVTLLADFYLDIPSPLLKLVVLSVLGAVAYAASLRLLHQHAWRELLDMAPGPVRGLLKRF
jgi:PST family polysaccharide transporter